MPRTSVGNFIFKCNRLWSKKLVVTVDVVSKDDPSPTVRQAPESSHGCSRPKARIFPRPFVARTAGSGPLCVRVPLQVVVHKVLREHFAQGSEVALRILWCFQKRLWVFQMTHRWCHDLFLKRFRTGAAHRCGASHFSAGCAPAWLFVLRWLQMMARMLMGPSQPSQALVPGNHSGCLRVCANHLAHVLCDGLAPPVFQSDRLDRPF